MKKYILYLTVFLFSTLVLTAQSKVDEIIDLLEDVTFEDVEYPEISYSGNGIITITGETDGFIKEGKEVTYKLNLNKIKKAYLQKDKEKGFYDYSLTSTVMLKSKKKKYAIIFSNEEKAKKFIKAIKNYE